MQATVTQVETPVISANVARVSGATFPVLGCKFDKVQVHIAMSNQHICKEETPTASIKKNRYFPISIERLPLSAFTFFVFFFILKG